MKKFLTGISLFAVVMVAAIYICNRNYYPAQAKGNDGYLGAIVDKHNYANRTKPPRVIFCGGSNVAFGINSKRIADSLGIPVVNLGIVGSLGLDFMLNEAKNVARPGDVIILSTEYYLTIDGTYAAKKEAQRVFPPASDFFKPTLRQAINDFFMEDLQKNFTVTFYKLTGRNRKGYPTNVVYSRSSFNSYGDVVRNFSKNPSHAFLNNFQMAYTYYDGIALLNSFKGYADDNNLKVYFLYPPFPQSLYRQKMDVINRYAGDFNADLRIKKLNNPPDAVLPDSLFYDTEYHLIPAGRELRTHQIIELLKREKINKAH